MGYIGGRIGVIKEMKDQTKNQAEQAMHTEAVSGTMVKTELGLTITGQNDADLMHIAGKRDRSTPFS